jgi:hypothetical protein
MMISNTSIVNMDLSDVDSYIHTFIYVLNVYLFIDTYICIDT